MQIGLANRNLVRQRRFVQRRRPQLRREDVIRRSVRRREGGERRSSTFSGFCCGTGDRGYAGATSLHQALDAAGVRHCWFEGPGSHEWQVRRKHLQDFAPRLFRGSAGKKTD